MVRLWRNGVLRHAIQAKRGRRIICNQDAFRAFVKNVHKRLWTARIYVISIKPSPSRWALWPTMQEANRLLKEECSRGKRLTYVDITPGMLDSGGQPHADIFLADNLHMNRKGYEAWREIVRPVLMKAERQYETPDDAAKQFPIGVWYEGGVGEFRDNLIPNDPAKASAVYNRDFADIAAHGLNAAVVPNSQISHNKVMLDAAKAHNLKLIVELDRGGGELGEIIRGGMPPTDENIRAALDTKLKPVISHPALLGVQLLDEPWPPFDRYAKVYSAFKAYAPNLLAFTCLPGPTGVKEFVETVKPEVVAYDDYPIRTTPVVIKDPMMKLEESLRAMCTEAAKHGTPVWSVLQAHAIDGYHPYPTPAQIRCRTYLSLANGCRGIWYFMYQTEGFSKTPPRVMYGLVDANYKDDERWEEVRLLAGEIKALAPTLLDLTISDSPKVECSSVAHVLRDSCGEVYVAVVNTDTLDSRKVTVKLDCSAVRIASVEGGSPSIRQGREVHTGEWSAHLDGHPRPRRRRILPCQVACPRNSAR